jgi:hypothetical protein
VISDHADSNEDIKPENKTMTSSKLIIGLLLLFYCVV